MQADEIRAGNLDVALDVLEVSTDVIHTRSIRLRLPCSAVINSGQLRSRGLSYARFIGVSALGPRTHSLCLQHEIGELHFDRLRSCAAV